MAQAGYNECLNFALCSFDDMKTFLVRDKLEEAVVIENPKTEDFQIGRLSLLPGILKTLFSNKMNKLPIQLFEVADVILMDDTHYTGAKNERRVACQYTHTKSSCLDQVHGTQDYLMAKLKIPFDKEKGYSLQLSQRPFYFMQLQAEIQLKGESIGHMGVLHPDILLHKDWLWNHPASVFELNLQKLADQFMENN